MRKKGKYLLFFLLVTVAMLAVFLSACDKPPKRADMVILYFDTMGGPPVEATTFCAGDSFELPAHKPYSGYAFGGWYMERSLTNPATKERVLEKSGDARACYLYAAWIKTHTIIFEINESKEEVIVAEGQIVSPPQKSMPGHFLDGWYRSASCKGEKIDFDKKITGDVHAYARWLENTYAVRFYHQYGVEEPEITYVHFHDLLSPAKERDKAGSKFLHWSSTPDGPAYDFSLPVTAELNLFAVYTRLFYIRFEDWDGSLLLYEILEEGDVPVAPDCPMQRASEFVGYYILYDPLQTIMDLRQCVMGTPFVPKLDLPADDTENKPEPESEYASVEKRIQPQGSVQYRLTFRMKYGMQPSDRRFFDFVQLSDGYYIRKSNSTGYPEELVLPVSYNGKPIRGIAPAQDSSQGAFASSAALRNLYIPSTYEIIGDHAFYSCAALRAITFGTGSGLTKIGAYAFSRAGLTRVVLPDKVRVLDRFAFQNSSIQQVVLNDRLQRIEEGVFARCRSLTALHIPQNVQSIAPGFTDDCTKLAAFTVSEDNAFFRAQNRNLYDKTCDTLIRYAPAAQGQSFRLPEEVTKLAANCMQGVLFLREVFVGGQVTAIGSYAFAAPRSMARISVLGNPVLGQYVFSQNAAALELAEGITALGDYALAEWQGKTLYVPASVERIGNAAFYGSAVQNLSFAPQSALQSIGKHAFFGSSLASIALPDGLHVIGERAFYGAAKLGSVTLPQALRVIETEAFFQPEGQTSKLSQICLPEALKYIGPFAFAGNTALQQVIFAGESTLAYILEGAFRHCAALTEITIPGTVMHIGDTAFQGTGALQAVHFQENSVLRTIGAYAFAAEEDNAQASISALDLRPLKALTDVGESAFEKQKNLTTLYLPSSLLSVGARAFAFCDLTVVDFGTESALRSIGIFAFRGNTSLTEICLPKGLELTADGSGGLIFFGCTALRYIDVQIGSAALQSLNGHLYSRDGATLWLYAPANTDAQFRVADGTQIIADFAMQSCGFLEEIILPASLLKIGHYAFAYNPNLSRLVVEGESSTISWGNFVLYDSPVLSVVIYAQAPHMIGEYSFVQRAAKGDPVFYVTEEALPLFQKAAYWALLTIQTMP